MKNLFKRAFGRKESLDSELFHEQQEDYTPRKATEAELNQIQFRITEMKQKEQLEEKELQVAAERAKQKQLLNDILNEEQLPLNPDAPDYIMDDEERAKKEATDIVSGILSNDEEDKVEEQPKQEPIVEEKQETVEPELEIEEESEELQEDVLTEVSEDTAEPEIDFEISEDVEEQEAELEIVEDETSDEIVFEESDDLIIEETTEENIVSEDVPVIENIEEDVSINEDEIEVDEISFEEEETVEDDIIIEEESSEEEVIIDDEEIDIEFEDDIDIELEDEITIDSEEDIVIEDTEVEVDDISFEEEVEIEEEIAITEEVIEIEEEPVSFEKPLETPILLNIEPEKNISTSSADIELFSKLFQLTAEDFVKNIRTVESELQKIKSSLKEDSSFYSPIKLYSHIITQIKENNQFTHYLEKLASITNEKQFFGSEESLLSLTNHLAHIRKMIQDTLTPVKRKSITPEDIQASNSKGLIQERIKPIAKRRVVKIVKKKPVSQ